MATTAGDILLDGKAYRLTAGGHHVSESVKTRPAPASQPRSLSTFEHQDNYIYTGESRWLGQGHTLWQGDGPFDIGYGIKMDPEGIMSVEDKMVLGRADTANPAGYVGFRIGYGAGPTGGSDGGGDRVIFVGKTDGKAMVKKTTGGWSGPTATGISSAGKKAVSYGFFSRINLVGDNNGHLWRTDLGTDWTDLGAPDASVANTNTYILGSFKGRLYVSFGTGSSNVNSIWTLKPDLTWDTGSGRIGLDAGILDMTAVCGASGTNVLYMVTEGPMPRILFHDGKELFQANVISSDFNPKAAVFFGKLFIFGEQGFDILTKGAAWTFGANGITEELSFGDASQNQGIQTAQIEGEVILWSATGNSEVPAGIGVWDPRLDQSPDLALGYYVGNIATDVGVGVKIHGLSALAGKRYMGVSGIGIYESTTPGTYFGRTSLYGADQRNLNKRWPVGEVHHSPLAAGQTVILKTRKSKEEAVETWGTSSIVGAKTKEFPSPADYRTPYLAMIVTGDANALPLTIYDIALGYIQAADHDNVKREWHLGIAVEGWDDPKNNRDPGRARQFTREGVKDSRTSVQLKQDLDALWNKEVCFEDIDGTTYKVLVKSVDYHPTAGWPSRFFPELDRYVDPATGTVKNLSIDYKLHLVETGPC